MTPQKPHIFSLTERQFFQCSTLRFGVEKIDGQDFAADHRYVLILGEYGRLDEGWGMVTMKRNFHPA